MNEVNEEVEKVVEDPDQEKEEDVDIYEDLNSGLDTSGDRESSDIIKRFNQRFGPKKGIIDDEFSAGDVSEEEEDVGLYDDLNTFDNQLKVEELEAKVELLEQRCSHLDRENAELKVELENVKKMNLAVKRNISSLYKTAKAEMERKERQLKELQREHDSLIFRRGGRIPPQKAPALLPADCQLLKKDPAKGNLVIIENETECTFQMGNMTVSFASENGDFRKSRLKRLESLVDGKEETQLPLKEVGENEKRPECLDTPTLKITKEIETDAGQRNGHSVSQSRKSPIRAGKEVKENNQQRLQAMTRGNESRKNEACEIEDGEVEEDVPTKVNPAPEVRDEPSDRTRRKDDSLQRRRSRSISPVGKRKRTPSVERRQSRRTRDLSPPMDRGPTNRSKQRRSPVKSSTVLADRRYRGGRGGSFHSSQSRSNNRR